MTPSNKQLFATTYAKAFIDSYPGLKADQCKLLIEKALLQILDNIHLVIINTPAFKLTAKRLGIKFTYQSFQEYLNQPTEK